MKQCCSLFIFLYVLLICLTSNIAHAQCTLDKSQWQLVFSEEFNYANATALLNTGDWLIGEPGWSGGVNKIEQSVCLNNHFNCFDASQITFNDNGIAYFNNTIQPPITCQNNIADVQASEISTTFNEFPGISTFKPGYLYGMFEIRCKLPSTKDSYPAFWLIAANAMAPSDLSEIDAFEHHGGDNTFFSTNYWPIPTGRDHCTNYFQYPTMNLSNDFHTWTVVWTPTEISWFFDGKELKTDSDPTHQPANDYVSMGNWQRLFQDLAMHVIVTNYLQCPDVENSNNEYDALEVDYVKIYKPNGLMPYNGTLNNNQLQNYYTNHLVPLYSQTPYKTTDGWYGNAITTSQFYPNEDITAPKTWLRGLQGGGKYMYKGKWDLLWTTYWDNGIFYNEPVDWTHNVNGHLALADNGNTTFYIDNNKIYYVSNSIYHQVNTVSDARMANVYDNISFVLPNNSADELFYISTSNTINFTKIQSGSWATPVTISPNNVNGSMISDPTGNFNNRVYYISNQNKICYVEWDPNTSSWINNTLSSVNDVNSDLAITSDGNKIFYKSTSGIIKYFEYQTSTNSWNNNTLMAKMWNTGSPVSINNILHDIIISPDLNNPQYYYIGTDNIIWVVYLDGIDFSAVPIHNNFSLTSSNLTNITFGQNPIRTHLCYAGIDNRIRTIEWLSPCSNINPSCDGIIVKKPFKNDTYTDNSYAQSNFYSMNNADFTISNDKEAANPQSINTISVYPNPVTTHAYVTYNSSINKIVLSSIDGRQSIINIPLSISDNRIEIDLKDMNIGIYILSVYTTTGIKTFKLTKI